MNKSFQKNLIAASVGAVLAAGSMVATAGTPGTTNLLFPYVTTQTGSYTFISITALGGVAANPRVHFTYAMKATSAANSAVCVHLDGDATMTPNDLMQFEIQNKVNMATTFGDTTSVAKYFPNTAAAANQHGMLIVNNDAAAGGTYGGAAAYLAANLYGEARIINTASGLAAGYSTDDLHTTGAASPDFALAGAGPDNGLSTKVISWFPDPTVSTSWFVEPLDTEAVMAFAGNASQAYGVYDSTATFLGHYNNNETFQSSTATAGVTCLGTFDRATLLGALNAPWSANGGWGVFALSAVPVPATATGSLIYKMESTTALGGTTSFITREPVL